MLLAFLACSVDYEITISPATLNLGVVDFAVEMPEEGYAPAPVTLTNAGKGTATLSLSSYDADYLCIVGFTGRDLPISLGELPEGSTYVLNIAACGYNPGDRDTEVTTEVTVATDGSPSTLSIPVLFTPTRTIGDDSG